MSELISNFHLLRPWWLAAALPAGYLLWLIVRTSDSNRIWKNIISDHLLRHLLISETTQNRIRPWHLLGVVWVVTIIALSGPAWQIEPSPFAEDQSALFIVLKVAPSMTADDIQPSRLDRAVHKIRDLMALRRGTLNGLIAYSGSAHLVMPLTRDHDIIESFAGELSPEIMPSEGDAMAEAVLLANEQLNKSGLSGSLLLVTDAVSEDPLQELARNQKKHSFPVHLLAIASENPGGIVSAPALDKTMLGKAARALGGSLTIVTPDEQDVENIASRVEKDLATMILPDSGQRWKDSGFWLVPFIAIFTLIWFRRGWVVRYE